MDWDKIHGLTHRTAGVQMSEDVGRQIEPYEVSLVKRVSAHCHDDREGDEAEYEGFEGTKGENEDGPDKDDRREEKHQTEGVPIQGKASRLGG